MTVRDLDIDIDVEVGVSELVQANQLADEFKDTLNDIKDVINIQVDLNDGGALQDLRELQTLLRDLDNESVHIDISIDDVTNDIALINAQLQTIVVGHDIDVQVDINDAQALVKLQNIHTLTTMLDTQRVEISVNTDTAQVITVLQNIKQLVNDLDNKHIHIRVSIDNIANEIAQMNTQLQSIDTSKNIDIDFGSVVAATAAVNDLVEELRKIDKNIKINIDIDLGDFLQDIALIHAQLATIRRHEIDVDVDTAAAMAQIALLQAQLAALQATSQININGIGSGGLLGRLGNPLAIAGKIAALIVLLPALSSLIYVTIGAVGTLGVAIGVLAGGLLALVSAIGVAAIGIGGFAALGITTIMELYDENAKLNGAQKELKKQTDSVAKSWKELKKTLQELTFGTIESGVSVINTLLGRSEPILRNATIAVDGLFTSMERSVNETNMTNFFSYLERSVAPLTANIGNGLGYALQGVFNWMVALEPLTNWVAQGFENMMSRFADWTASLQGSDRMAAFMDYVMQNMPKIGDIIGGATDGVVGFFEAFDVTGADGLTWMADKMKDFAEWSAGLDDNQGFQNMLEIIKTDGPVVAEILGNITTALMDLTTMFANLGRGDGETNVGLKYFKGLTDGTFIPKEIKLAAKLFGFGKDEVPDIEIDVKANTSQFNADIGNLKTTAPKVEVPTIAKIDPMTFRAGFNNSMAPVTVPVQASELKINKEVPAVDVPAKVSKIDTSQLGPVKIPMQLPANDSSNGFKWPPLPTFVWPVMPKFEWPTMPRFSWPAYPRFTWPPMPIVRVQVNNPGGLGPRLPGFSSGLGRVPADMPAVVHKEEAILQGHNANFLRDIGVLKGEGRNPEIDTNAMASYGSGSRVSTTPTSSNSTTNQTVNNTFTINVQGGNTNAETGQSVQDAMEDFFAKMGFAMFNPREG